MSDINAPQIEHDVFVSFRGEDIRDNFLAHLVAAFDRKQITTSVDYKFKRGKETWPAIVEGIEKSSISLIIFSENYATSRWCLKELVHILEWTKKYNRIVIPVFYYVNPRDVKHQTGSYENAFAEHRKKYNSTEVQSWRDALNKSAGLLGIKSSDCGNDAVLIDEIVSHVLRELSSSNNSVNSSGLFGIEKQIETVKSLLDKRIEGTRFIGIWGIGGIGKTTIAKAIFNKLGSEYGGRCFLQNVREESAKHEKNYFLKKKLFSKLLDEEVKLDTFNGLPDHVKRRVKRMKVLIVLDDVDDLDQLEILDGDGDWFQSGSTVIITTRNKQVVPVEDDCIYKVGALDFDDALDLFNLHAFKHSRYKKEDYCGLLEKVVKYSDGIPLVLKVLGGHLRGKNKEIWESELNELEKMPLGKVYNSLKLSYDDLDTKRQEMFLDLACFFVGLNLKVEYIEALLKEGENDNSVSFGLEMLKDRALITFSKFGGVSMHDIIQEMAWEIVFRECREDPGRRSRLWDPDGIYEVLQNDKGSEAIKSIKVPLTVVSKLKLSPHIFAKMSKLQFLHIGKGTFFSSHSEMNLLLPQGLQSLPPELRYLVWEYYPLKSLPEKFSAEKLVILNLSNSLVEKLWQGVQNLVNLKEVQLYFSFLLKELPDFSKATNLETLNAFGCHRATNVHPSIFSLKKLFRLSLACCESLGGLPTEIHLRSVSYLQLNGCENASEFSVTIYENMIKLDLAGTRVIALVALFGSQSKLECLNLADCYYIESLPSCLNKCTKLTKLNIRGCKKLKTLPELPSSLEILVASNCTSLETISFPSSVEQFRENKKRVQFWNCLKLDEHSLVAIGLNAQINMMKFACKHLPAHDASFNTFEAQYVYPGSSVPEWFVYKTTEDYIVIDLSAPNSPILGFIFCFVLGKFPSSDYFKFNITICDDEGEGKGYHTVELSFFESYIDHVCVLFDQTISRFLINRARNLRRLKIKVAIVIEELETTVWLRGFGVSPINTSSLHDLCVEIGCKNEDPESTCSNPTKKRRCRNEERSMSDVNASQIAHDVFISFRGKDVRDNFLSHLVKAFDGKKIKTSVDDTFKRGEKIWSEIVKAIEGSSISLIIFSENYATSRWCLNELVQILECRKKYKLIAIPVFYRVDPTDVKHQTGSYQKAFDELEKNNDSAMVQCLQSWRGALSESTGLAGINSSKFGKEAELIDEIVSRVLRELNRPIGIEKQIAPVGSFLNKKSEGTRFIGIWGIGGIGKTTIAEEIFNKLRSVYDGSCFLPKVREESVRYGKEFLKEKLFSKLLGDKVELDTSNRLPAYVKRRVQRMKVLIVLDDVNNSNQLEILDGHGDWFRSGSTVIITTRDRQVVPAEDNYIHEVGKLDFDDALELFNLNAFEHSPYKKEEYCELSKKVVKYADGIPLVLKILGRLLRGKDKEIWKSEVNKLKKMPPEEVYESLKLSYEGLDRKEQKIFLDLACFLVGLNLKVEYIKALLKEGENDTSVADGLESLKDRALITFSEDDGISMHDIIQEMAWEIVSRECPEDPGRRSRLGHPDDIYQVLQNDKGSETIKSIKVPLTAVSKLKLRPHIFAKMSKLQFLHVPGEYYVQELLPHGLQSLPTELRYLVWMNYPLKSLPEKFSAEKLVILNLSGSKVEKLWQGVQNLVNLKEVDLCFSYFLKQLPDFSNATNLELLNAYNCRRLTNVHPSIFSLEKLDKLDLSYCKSLSGLPVEIHSRSLSYLTLSNSENTSEFSVTISENMIKLTLAYTRVIALAASFGSQSKLEHVYLEGCYYIESLPSCFNKCTKLTLLNIRNCKELKTLPELPSSLETLFAGDCTSLETISFPSSVEQFRENRKRVEFWNCLKLDEYSLVAIGLNAQINMMKFACKHLPAHDDSFGNFQAKYVYPGSSVPEWFVYKTTEDYMVIDLFAPHSPILGFIFCFVLGEFPYALFKFNITICDDEGEGKRDTVEIYFSESNIDHVCVMYDQRFSRFLSKATNLKRLKIKVAIPHLEKKVWSRGFGVYPINTTSRHDFIQKMELLDFTLQSI